MFTKILENLNDGLNLKLLDLNNPANFNDTAIGILTNNIITILVAIAGIIFILMFVIGGIRYITSNGNENSAKSAKTILSFAVGGLVLVLFAYILPRFIRDVAQTMAGERTFFGISNANDSLYGAINVLLQVLLAIVALLAVLFIIIGGIRYIASAGNEEQRTKARKTITNSVIGLVAVLFSAIVLNFIAYFIGLIVR